MTDLEILDIGRTRLLFTKHARRLEAHIGHEALATGWTRLEVIAETLSWQDPILAHRFRQTLMVELLGRGE